MIGVTLTRYLALRFLKVILAIFAGIFCLMFVIQFVELLRRSSDIPQIGTGTVALMTIMRVPAAAEMILPFAVLFGSMATFVELTRKLELIVARAAGVSVWQFLAPPVIAAFAIGVVSVTLYNPVSAAMKQRSERMEFDIFGVPGSLRIDHGIWLRQHSVDGLAIVHAAGVAAGGTQLTGVSVSVYTPDGTFLERVEAASAELSPGAWRLTTATVTAPGERSRSVGSYLLATELTPEQLASTATPPEGTPFWNLPSMSESTREAGLDGTGYRLQFQTLMARPLLLVAMVLLAASFSLRFFRLGNVAQTISGGVAAGFVLYIVTKVLSDLGGAGMISPLVAAWSPALIGSMLGTLTLLHSEDG
jgi:lipopolysaccharide export system permease protein